MVQLKEKKTCRWNIFFFSKGVALLSLIVIVLPTKQLFFLFICLVVDCFKVSVIIVVIVQ